MSLTAVGEREGVIDRRYDDDVRNVSFYEVCTLAIPECVMKDGITSGHNDNTRRLRL